LDALEQGDSVAQILARYPDFADELRPFLATAVHLTQLPVQPTLAAQQASQQQFLRQAADLRAGTQSRQSWRRWYQLLAPVISLVFLLVVGGSLAMASGNALYGARQWIESIPFMPTAEPEPSLQPSQTPRPQETDVVVENTAVPTATTPVEDNPTVTPTQTKSVAVETAVPSPTATASATITATPQPATPTATPDDDGDNSNDNSINDNGNDDNSNNDAGNDNSGGDDNSNDNTGSDDDSNNNDDNGNDNDNDDGGNSGPGNNNNDNDDDDDDDEDNNDNNDNTP
jgi:hypothetical protein